jgi:hypothetical protein
MRENRQYGSEGGARGIPCSDPYHGVVASDVSPI